MSTKRSRKCNFSDDEDLPGKHFKSSAKSNNILLVVNKFKQNILNYNKAIEKIKHIMYKPDVFIYDECFELKRTVQLETEELIASIKQSNGIDVDTDETNLEPDLFSIVQNVIEQSQQLIDTIDACEKATKTHWLSNEIDKKLFTRDFNKLKKFSELFLQSWIDPLDQLDFDNEKMIQAAKKLKEHKFEPNDLIKQIKMYLFNNNCIALRRFDSDGADKDSAPNRLNYYIHYEQLKIYKETKKINLKDIIKLSSIQVVKDIKNLKDYFFSFQVLNNDKYLVLYGLSFFDPITYLAIFDPILNKLDKEQIINYNLHEFDINCNHNSIAFNKFSYFDLKSHLIIMNYDLQVVKQISLTSSSGICSIRGFDESFIYISGLLSTDVQVFDWSLKEVKTIRLQENNSKEPFFHYFQYIQWKFKSIKDFYVLSSWDSTTIYDKNGALIKKITYDNFQYHIDGLDIIDSKECIVLANKNERKLNYYDLKGKLLKQISLISIDLEKSVLQYQVLFDSNNDFVIFNKKNSTLYI